MKSAIHPPLNPVIFIDEDSGDEIFSYSTLTSSETREVEGVTYQVVRLDVTAFSHPFFTNEMRFVDRQGRVDNFYQKMKKAESQAKTRGGKRKQVKTEPVASQSYREFLQSQQTSLRQADKKAGAN